MSLFLFVLGCESLYFVPKNRPEARVMTEMDRISMFEPRWLVTMTSGSEPVLPVGCLRVDERDLPPVRSNIISGTSPQSAWDKLVYPEKIYIDKSISGGPLVVDEHPAEESGVVEVQMWKLLSVDGDPYGEDRSFRVKDTVKGDMDVRVKWVDRRRGLAIFLGGPFGEGVMVVEGNMASEFPTVSVNCSGELVL